MNRLILSTFLLFFGSVSCSYEHIPHNPKYFEGTVTYKGDFTRKTEKYDSATLALLAGQTTTLYTKEGNYLVIVEGGITTRLLYRNKENKVYRQRLNSDSVYWSRCDQPGQKILKIEKKPNVESILGIECDEFKVSYENRTVTIYYNPDTLKSNPDWYKNSTSYNENIYSSEMKSLNLKTVIEYKDFVLTQTAIDINKHKLDDALFQIPKKPLVEDE